MQEPVDRVTALSAVYQAERQTAANNALGALALIAGALTYLGVAALLINDASPPGGAWFLALLAFPLWVVTSFHVLLVGSALVRSKSIEIIERQLLNYTGLSDQIRESLGSRAEQRIMNVDEQPVALKVQTFICYGGVGAVIVAFSVTCLAVAAKRDGWISAPVIFAGMIYVLLLAAALVAWIYVLSLAKAITAAASK